MERRPINNASRPESSTDMFKEAAEAPAIVADQLRANREFMRRLGERLRLKPPRAVVTLGRGSSDNAATFARYLIETRLGVMTASAPPSVTSLYAATPSLESVLCLAVSQSGRSPDLLSAVEAARSGGALVVALVNAEDSPLAALADLVAPIRAGPEQSVAATKSYLAALTAIAQLVGSWAGDDGLSGALDALPALMNHAWDLDWTPLIAPLSEAGSLYVIGRGVGYAVAQEAALKFKETCGLHAEAFSAAEVRHGPMALVGRGFPALILSQNDESRSGIEVLAAEFAARGAAVFLAGSPSATATAVGSRRLPGLATHSDLEPILLAQSFYRMANALALTRGRDPDHPPHLAKVTETL